MTSRLCAGGILLSMLIVIAGCAREARKAVGEQQRSHLGPLVVLYTSATSSLRRSPKDEAEFRSFVQSQKGKMLDMLGIDNPDELFVSERDGQPYVVRYGSPGTSQSPDLIAYEQTGIDGRRMVGYANGIVVELDEAKFHELVPE